MRYKLEYRPGDGTEMAPDAPWWASEWDEEWEDENGSHWMPVRGFKNPLIAIGYVMGLNDEDRRAQGEAVS